MKYDDTTARYHITALALDGREMCQNIVLPRGSSQAKARVLAAPLICKFARKSGATFIPSSIMVSGIQNITIINETGQAMNGDIIYSKNLPDRAL